MKVLSPDQNQNDIHSKIDDYFEGGARLVWIINARRKIVTVYNALDDIRLLTMKDTLDGDPVLPGFSLPLKDIFPAE